MKSSATVIAQSLSEFGRCLKETELPNDVETTAHILEIQRAERDSIKVCTAFCHRRETIPVVLFLLPNVKMRLYVCMCVCVRAYLCACVCVNVPISLSSSASRCGAYIHPTYNDLFVAGGFSHFHT